MDQEELKDSRLGHDAIMEQDALHTGYEADAIAHLLDTDGGKVEVTGLLDTGAVVSVMPIKTRERMGFTREDLIPTKLGLAAAYRGAIYVAGRTPTMVFHMRGWKLWMSFLVVEILENSNQFKMGRDFVRNCDLMIDLHKRAVNRIITDETKIKTWETMGFSREDLIPTNLPLAAVNRGAIYVAGRTPITVLHMGGRDLWMSFLVVENLDDSDQFILGRDFVENFDLMIDLNNGLIRIRNPDRKYVKKPVKRIITDENKVPF